MYYKQKTASVVAKKNESPKEYASKMREKKTKKEWKRQHQIRKFIYYEKKEVKQICWNSLLAMTKIHGIQLLHIVYIWCHHKYSNEGKLQHNSHRPTYKHKKREKQH